MAIVRQSPRKLRDYSVNLFAGWYAVTRFTPTLIRILR
jgi:hypothetical protein